jgi:hypothetical protein
VSPSKTPSSPLGASNATHAMQNTLNRKRPAVTMERSPSIPLSYTTIDFSSNPLEYPKFTRAWPPEPSDSVNKCEECNVEFRGNYGRLNLTRHIRNRHKASLKHACAHCGRRFKRQDARRVHYRRNHPDSYTPLSPVRKRGQRSADLLRPGAAPNQLQNIEARKDGWAWTRAEWS